MPRYCRLSRSGSQILHDQRAKMTPAIGNFRQREGDFRQLFPGGDHFGKHLLVERIKIGVRAPDYQKQHQKQHEKSKLAAAKSSATIVTT